MLYQTSNLPTTGISNKDKQVLRKLALHVREIAESPDNLLKKELNYCLNDLAARRPLIMAHNQMVWEELYPASRLECENPLMRIWENEFQMRIFQHETIKDDTPQNADFVLPWIIDWGNFGVESQRVAPTQAGGSFTWSEFALANLDQDFDKLHFRQPTVDRSGTIRQAELAHDLFGDLLDVQTANLGWWTVGLTVNAIELIGIENLMMFMYDNPKGLHRLMAWLRDEQQHMLDWVEQEKLLGDNCSSPMTGTGGNGYTHDLPRKGRLPGAPVRLADMWGIGESQETVGVSPEMFGEFVFAYQKPLMERYGLIYYGCCEAVESRLDYILTIPNLRAVSVSPWANREIMAERLGKKYLYCCKPNPTQVSVSFNEDAIRQDLRDVFRISGNLNSLVLLKDVMTVQNETWRIPQWVEIAREELARYLGA